VWLPLEIAIIHRRTADTGRQALLTRRAAAILVGALELAVIIGALTSGALVEATSMGFLLALPAIVVTAVFFVIWVGIEDVPGQASGGYDWGGLALITVALGLVMGGLITIRVQGPGSPLAWGLVLLGLIALVPFARYEAAHPEPMVDVRLLATPGQWPVQLTAFLFGMSVLGAQIPLSTFARTDPDTAGYGLGWQEDYPFRLQEMLGDSYKVQNFGVSSMTFANKGPSDNMSYWNTDKFKAALEFNPEIVVIELGTNDSKFFTNNCIENGQPQYNYNYGQYEKEQLYKDYEALLDTFMHLATSPRVIATLQPYSNNCGWGIMDTAIVNQINPIIEEVATRKGVEIIDLHSQFNTPAWFLADSVHPNATGAKELWVQKTPGGGTAARHSRRSG
jgi:lysophospholipase L1-like esterase